jgi:hypothetical protein
MQIANTPQPKLPSTPSSTFGSKWYHAGRENKKVDSSTGEEEITWEGEALQTTSNTSGMGRER